MAANPTIIKQNVQDWFEILKKLGNYELFPEEQTIIEYLKDYWRNVNNVGDDDDQCKSYLEQLKDFKKQHPKAPEISTLCNQLRGLVEKNFLRDNDTYHLFQQTAREYVKQHKPQTPKPQQPKPQQPQQPKPRVNMAIVKVNVQEWCEHMQKLAYSNISDDELTLINWLWNYPFNFTNIGEDSGQCRTCLEMIKEFKNRHAKDPEVVTLSNKLRGIAEKMFLTDNATYQAFKQQLQQTIQADPLLGLSPVGHRENIEASRELEQELEELFESANTPQPKPQQPPKPQPTPPTKPTGFSRPPTPQQPQKPTTTTPKPQSTTTTTSDDGGGSWGCGCLIIIIAAVLYFGGWNWLKGCFSSHDDTETNQVSMFVLVESLNMRDAPTTNSNVLKTLGYGDHLYMDENNAEDWAPVRTNSTNGFVARGFIGTRDEIDALVNVFSTDGTRQAVTDIRYRRALIQFVKESMTTTNYDADEGYTLYASGSNSGNVWWDRSMGDNGVFAFILDKGNGGRVAAVCSYDQNDNPYFRFVTNDVEPGQYIEKVTCRNNEFKIIFGNKKGKKKQKTQKVEKATEVIPTAPSIDELRSQKNAKKQSTENTSTGFHFESVE